MGKKTEKRGLSNMKDTPRALDVWEKKESKEIFTRLGI